MSVHTVKCPCGCGEAVSMEFGSFESTTVEVKACSTQAARWGVSSTTFRKSAAASFEAA